MKPTILFAILFSVFPLALKPVEASPLTFSQFLCELPTAVLDEKMGALRTKYENAYDRYAPRSSYRRHVERHVKELARNLESEDTLGRCEPKRREKLIQWRNVLNQPPWIHAI